MALLSSTIELAIIGMGVVFLSLLALMFVIQLLSRTFTDWNGGDRTQTPQSVASGEKGTQDQSDELSFVLAAAAGYFLETERSDIFIPEVSRTTDSSWARRARTGRPIPRRTR